MREIQFCRLRTEFFPGICVDDGETQLAQLGDGGPSAVEPSTCGLEGTFVWELEGVSGTHNRLRVVELPFIPKHVSLRSSKTILLEELDLSETIIFGNGTDYGAAVGYVT